MLVRQAEHRGHTDLGWLNSRHSFSFGQYYDPDFMGFGHLRVINDDRVMGGGGFPTHPHHNMEIITYVLDGALEHQDSMGNGTIIMAGEVQRMSAGSGVTHSEFNHSNSDPVHFLQIWIEPDTLNMPPSYAQTYIEEAEKAGRFKLVACPEGHNGAMKLHQDARLYLAHLNGQDHATYPLTQGRHGWVQLAGGSVELNGTRLEAGDGAGFEDAATLSFSEGRDAEILLFDMAA